MEKNMGTLSSIPKGILLRISTPAGLRDDLSVVLCPATIIFCSFSSSSSALINDGDQSRGGHLHLHHNSLLSAGPLS